MSVPLVDIKKQFESLKEEINPQVLKILGQGNFILGKEVEEFEKSFAQYLEAKHCIGVSSGSAALRLALRSLDIGPGDEVITVANTFISTVLPILELGAKPILVDINPNTYQMDPTLLEKVITKRTKVILPVHLYGIPAPMNKILKIAKKHKLKIIEDACQAHGSSLDGKMCGTFGELSAFSFYPGKNLGAAGDGGAIVTNSSELDQKLRAIRNIGQVEKYKHDLFGYNSRLDTIQAVVLSIKLKHLDQWNAQRRVIAQLYSSLLADLPIVLPPNLGDSYVVNYHLYVIRTKRRDALLKYLHDNGVYAGIHYPIPVHLQKSIQKTLGYKKGDFPLTEKYAEEIMSLPIYAELEEKDVKQICQLISDFFKKDPKNA